MSEIDAFVNGLLVTHDLRANVSKRYVVQGLLQGCGFRKYFF